MTVNSKYFYHKLATVLTTSAFVLSVLVGIAVLYFELSSKKHVIAALALDQAVTFMSELSIHFARADGDHAAVSLGLRRLLAEHAHLPDGHFVLGRVYSADGQKIAEEQSASTFGVAVLPPSDVPEKVIAGKIRHQLLFTDGGIYVSILAPIPGISHGYEGLFQGVYLVDRATLFRLAGHALLAVAICTAIVAAHTGFLYPFLASLNRQLVDASRDLLDANLSMLETLGTAVAMRDGQTGAHNYRVTLYATGLGEAINLPPRDMRALIKGAFLHDVGKIGVSDAILLKPAGLTSSEFDLIKLHVTHGLAVVRQSRWLADAEVVVAGHHEMWDGSGYPQGLAGEEIPLLARVFAIADVFDALTSLRPYKPALSLKEAWIILERGRGVHFDPKLLRRFRSISGNMYERLTSCDKHELKTYLGDTIQKYFRNR
jgi:Response regulator containing a CheY-like receiver domain and an HD-GYP domain